MRIFVSNMTASLLLLSAAGCNDSPSPPLQNASAATNTAPAESLRPTAPQPIVLDGLLHFSDTAQCDLDGAGGTLVDGLLKINGKDPISLGEVVAPAQYRAAFGQPTLETVRHPDMAADEEPTIKAKLPVQASWFGLPLIRIDSAAANFSDAWAYSFLFDAPFETVRSTLNGQGFAFDAEGRQPQSKAEASPFVQLTREGTRTTLDCWF
ncbi:MAG: hypothetical protein ACOY5R_15100 [Pseudomonadota bacterium]